MIITKTDKVCLTANHERKTDPNGKEYVSLDFTLNGCPADILDLLSIRDDITKYMDWAQRSDLLDKGESDVPSDWVWPEKATVTGK